MKADSVEQGFTRICHSGSVAEVGLPENPELQGALVLGCNCCKVGASHHLQRVVGTFSGRNVLAAGGQVATLASLTSEKDVCARRGASSGACHRGSF